ncbi:hypothetical protein BGZ65_005829, partial [Modicella reniformis]
MSDKVISIPSIPAVLIPLLILLCTVFGPGLLNVAPAPYISIAMSLGYLDRLGPCSWAAVFPNLYLFACIAVGTGIAYAGMLQADDWDNALLGTPFLIGLGVALVEMIPLWVHLVWQRRFLPQDSRFQNGAWALLGTLVAPTVWVALFTLVYAVSPIGSYGSIAYTQFQLEPIVQWSSVAGIGGIEFLMVWSSVIIYRSWIRYVRLDAVEEAESKPLNQPSDVKTHHHRSRLLSRIAFAPTPTFLIVSLFVYLYGSMRFWNGTGTFYMKPLRETMLPTVKAGCVIGSSHVNDMTSYLNQTIKLAKEGSKIVIWSESAVHMRNAQMLNDFWVTAKNISTTYGIYLGVTYSEYDEDKNLIDNKNMFTLFDPKGKVSFEYQKAHPVTMVETTVIAGPNKLPVVDSDFGRLGGAICFDMDFHNFIAQAGDQKVDILLQPSWTW